VVFRAAIVGPSGIGAIHARELVACGCEQLDVVAASPQSAITAAARLQADLKVSVSPVPKVEDLAARDNHFVSICSPTHLHLEHLDALAKSRAFIFVEKPLFWDHALSPVAVEQTTQRLLDRHKNRLMVNQPLESLVSRLLELIGAPRQPSDLKFRYHTKGRNTGRDIAIDLLPHALSCIYVILRVRGDQKTPISKIRSRASERGWILSLECGTSACEFDLVNDPALTESSLEIEVDGRMVRRRQQILSGIAEVALERDGKIHPIPNPMSEQIRLAVAASRQQIDLHRQAGRTMRLMADMALIMVHCP
jgi:hypothetical protein